MELPRILGLQLISGYCVGPKLLILFLFFRFNFISCIYNFFLSILPSSGQLFLFKSLPSLLPLQQIQIFKLLRICWQIVLISRIEFLLQVSEVFLEIRYSLPLFLEVRSHEIILNLQRIFKGSLLFLFDLRLRLDLGF